MSKTRLAGIAAASFGVLFLFYIFLNSTLLPPGLKGMAWWSAVLRTMVSRGAVAGTLLGVLFVIGGIVLIFQGRRHRLSVLSVAVLVVLGVLTLLAVALG